MYDGKKLEDGPADKVFANPSHTLTEEILTHFLPFTGPAHLRFFEDGGSLYLEIEQKNFAGPLIEGREGTDELSLTIIKGICSEITETPNGSDWITLLHFGKA